MIAPIQQLVSSLQQEDVKSLARLITVVENELNGYYDVLTSLPISDIKITGITGPPGAGKSTLTDALIGEWVNQGKRVGVLCVDPSSPFNQGALLGDRIRMSDWYNHPAVFIRSMASRGSLGGLSPSIMEVADVMRAAWFDHIIIETVGVGQSEVEIAGIADTSIVVLTPEGGDEVQTMKAGLMEIADLFVVNKADRPGAAAFIKNLRTALSYYERHHSSNIAVIKTVATEKSGLQELTAAIETQQQRASVSAYKYALLAEKAFRLVEKQRMRTIRKEELKESLIKESGENFNLYRFVQRYFN
jgi:LAO/AO transport system kinase